MRHVSAGLVGNDHTATAAEVDRFLAALAAVHDAFPASATRRPAACARS